MGQNLEADVIVIGSGATGLTAALTAAEGGAKVIMFEKQRSLGGTSNFFEGTFAVESRMQREQYIMYTKDEAFKGIMEYSHWRANPRIVRAIVNESGDTIGWLQQAGVEFMEATINMPNAPRTYHTIKGSGAALIKALAVKAKEKGVDIRLGVAVKQILKEGNRISGVIIEQNDEEVEVVAKAVIIGSGGYANNKEWIKKYHGFELDVNMFAAGSVDKTGEGIRMAWELGAAGAEDLGVLEVFSAGPGGPEFAMKNQLELAGIQPNLWVNPKGERFCDETIAFYDSSLGNACAKYKEGVYRLFDTSIKEYLMVNGIHKNLGVENPPGTRLLDLDKELDAAFERGTTEIFVADSIEELAAKMGVDPATLMATVEEYNSFCEDGYDALFAKDRKYLLPLKGPKYYSIRARSVFLGTMGGIKINQNMEVVDKKEKTISGLYAGGFDAGGMWGDSYCINASSGLASSFALNSGRIAGKSVMKYLEK